MSSLIHQSSIQYICRLYQRGRPFSRTSYRQHPRVLHTFDCCLKHILFSPRHVILTPPLAHKAFAAFLIRVSDHAFTRERSSPSALTPSPLDRSLPLTGRHAQVRCNNTNKARDSLTCNLSPPLTLQSLPLPLVSKLLNSASPVQLQAVCLPLLDRHLCTARLPHSQSKIKHSIP